VTGTTRHAASGIPARSILATTGAESRPRLTGQPREQPKPTERHTQCAAEASAPAGELRELRGKFLGCHRTHVGAFLEVVEVIHPPPAVQHRDDVSPVVRYEEVELDRRARQKGSERGEDLVNPLPCAR